MPTDLSGRTPICLSLEERISLYLEALPIIDQRPWHERAPSRALLRHVLNLTHRDIRRELTHRLAVKRAVHVQPDTTAFFERCNRHACEYLIVTGDARRDCPGCLEEWTRGMQAIHRRHCPQLLETSEYPQEPRLGIRLHWSRQEDHDVRQRHAFSVLAALRGAFHFPPQHRA